MHYFTRLLVLLMLLLLAACSNASEVAEQPATPFPVPTITGMATAHPTETASTQPAHTPSPVPTMQWPPPSITPLVTSTPVPTPQPLGPVPAGEIFFLRDDVLMAYDTTTRQERQLATAAREVVAGPDGTTLALVRTDGQTNSQNTELWLINRDGSDLHQVSDNHRVEGHLSWAPDGGTLLFESAESSPSCWRSDVRLLDIESGNETTLAAGCDPAISHDGLRIAFATPPVREVPPDSVPPPGGANSIRIINRQGDNGWDFATATGEAFDNGWMIYGPLWSPDDSRLLYVRYLGSNFLGDIYYLERGNSFGGPIEPLARLGSDQTLRFSSSGDHLLEIASSTGGAGYGGYRAYHVSVIQLDVPGEMHTHEGISQQVNTRSVDHLGWVASAAWAPDRLELVVLASTRQDPPDAVVSGNLWRWIPGNEPDVLLVEDVDFGSPLLWLPPQE